MEPARTLLVLAASPASSTAVSAGLDALAGEARPGIAWNVLDGAGLDPGALAAAVARADLVVALPDLAEVATPDAAGKLLRADAGLPPPALYRPLPEAPTRRLERILVVADERLGDRGTALCRALSGPATVTLAAPSAAQFLALPELAGITVRLAAGDAAWWDLLAQHDLVVTADAAVATLANALLKPAVLVAAAPPTAPAAPAAAPLPFVFAAAEEAVPDVVARLRPAESGPDLLNWKRAGQAAWVAALDGALAARGL